MHTQRKPTQPGTQTTMRMSVATVSREKGKKEGKGDKDTKECIHDVNKGEKDVKQLT